MVGDIKYEFESFFSFNVFRWIGLGSLRTTVFAALLLLSWLCASLQRAYIFAGLIRNPLFPRSSDVSALKAHRRHTRMVAALRVILLKIGKVENKQVASFTSF